MTRPVINREVAKKILCVVDAGLSKGLGTPKPGQMCVEAAVCYALGLPHSDDPQCVGQAVRSFKIALNDADWSSKKARALGMRRVAIAQLGSDHINQVEFAKEVALQTIKQILPITLRSIGLEKEAIACEASLDLNAAASASSRASSRAANAAANAANAANYANYAAANAAASASASAATTYAANAANYANYANYAASTAAAATTYAAEKKDSILQIAADIAVNALIKLGSKGVEWLDLCD